VSFISKGLGLGHDPNACGRSVHLIGLSLASPSPGHDQGQMTAYFTCAPVPILSNANITPVQPPCLCWYSLSKPQMKPTFRNRMACQDVIAGFNEDKDNRRAVS